MFDYLIVGAGFAGSNGREGFFPNEFERRKTVAGIGKNYFQIGVVFEDQREF